MSFYLYLAGMQFSYLNVSEKSIVWCQQEGGVLTWGRGSKVLGFGVILRIFFNKVTFFNVEIMWFIDKISHTTFQFHQFPLPITMLNFASKTKPCLQGTVFPWELNVLKVIRKYQQRIYLWPKMSLLCHSNVELLIRQLRSHVRHKMTIFQQSIT